MHINYILFIYLVFPTDNTFDIQEGKLQKKDLKIMWKLTWIAPECPVSWW